MLNIKALIRIFALGVSVGLKQPLTDPFVCIVDGPAARAGVVQGDRLLKVAFYVG